MIRLSLTRTTPTMMGLGGEKMKRKSERPTNFVDMQIFLGWCMAINGAVLTVDGAGLAGSENHPMWWSIPEHVWRQDYRID